MSYILKLTADIDNKMPQNLDFMTTHEVFDQVNFFFQSKQKTLFCKT